jgi:hypothetical protein
MAWSIAWAPLGVLTGVLLDPTDTMDEPWIAVGAYPGFLSGLIFASALGLVRGHPKLRDLSPQHAALLGALSGLVVMAIPFLLGGTPNTEHVLWQGRFVLLAAIVILSAISAVLSVHLARMTKRRVVGHSA